jgi:hypothetical protein
MKNKAAGFYASSLEMLLDTMCSMLGGVVFIALTVALFAQYSTTHTPEQYREQSVQLSNNLAVVVASNTVVESALQTTLQRLQDPRLQPHTNVMRLPNLEKNTTKKKWMVIMQYGKIYPLDVFVPGGHGGTVLNNRSLQFQAQSGDVKPRPGLGDDPERGVANMVQVFMANAKTNYYFGFVVYDDSFDAFTRARETATKLGFQYGWEPLPENQPLRLSWQGQGEQILPQN